MLLCRLRKSGRQPHGVTASGVCQAVARSPDIAVLQSHCKICLIRSPKGDAAICGSANLSSSNNVENFVLLHDRAVIDYLQARLDNVMERFTVFRGLTGYSDHRRKRNTGRDAYLDMMSDKLGG